MNDNNNITNGCLFNFTALLNVKIIDFFLYFFLHFYDISVIAFYNTLKTSWFDV